MPEVAIEVPYPSVDSCGSALRFSASPLLRFFASSLLRFFASSLLRFFASSLLRFFASPLLCAFCAVRACQHPRVAAIRQRRGRDACTGRHFRPPFDERTLAGAPGCTHRGSAAP